MVRVILDVKPRKNPFLPVEAESLAPKNFVDEREPRDLSVWVGNKERRLEEVVTLTREGTATSPEDVELVLRGDTSRFKRVGEYMEAGRITIEGDIGMHCGNLMKGGMIVIHGNADSWLAREMVGGTVRCNGDAHHYCASGYRGEKRGMRGGEVEVMGNAGDFTAEYLTGGSVTIHGNSGDLTGVEMAGGTLIVHGDCSRVCANMTGGTGYVYGMVHHMIPTFRFRETAIIGPEKVKMSVFEGDIANRGKGTLFIKVYKYPL